ncbi:MAG: energy transducer TonB [Cyclobacteriaceae bacterium]
MKKTLILFACAAALTLTNCGKQKEESTETTVSAENAASSVTPAESAEERRARIKREREEYAERRRLSNEERAKTAPTYKDAKGRTVYNSAEVMPSFRGSEDELEQYIQDNINYPSTAQTDQIEGTVFVEFVVGADGKVRDAEVVEATNDTAKQNFSEEAVRVVSNMPTWTAGTQAGKPVDVRVTLPITFQLEM